MRKARKQERDLTHCPALAALKTKALVGGGPTYGWRNTGVPSRDRGSGQRRAGVSPVLCAEGEPHFPSSVWENVRLAHAFAQTAYGFSHRSA